MAQAIDTLFEKEKDISSHLKDMGVILLDISDSVKDRLSQKDSQEVMDLLTTFSMNCDAITDDLNEAEQLLKKVKAKAVTIQDTSRDTSDLKKHIAAIKGTVQKLRQNTQEFFAARDRKMVFEEMNQQYSHILAEITELMAESV